MAAPFLRARLVTETEFVRHFARVGAVYFIRNDELDCIKIGHSREPYTRLSNLQVGSPSPLRIVGLIAAEAKIEPVIHEYHVFGRRRGEWFDDRGVVTGWLTEITYGFPMGRNIWDLVPGREFFTRWDDQTGTRVKHLFNEETGEWEPPIP